MTDGSAYMMRASSAWERDLVTLSLRTFLTEYPPLDVPAARRAADAAAARAPRRLGRGRL
eukprot:scaffold93937_cov45-Phaeocystis_antarctica.AAC.1